MPYVRITTSLKRDQIPASAVAALSKGFCEILGVGEEIFNLMITTDQIVCKAGDQKEPAADVILSHIEDCGAARNEAIAGKLTALLAEQLKLPENRFSICVYPIQRHEIIMMGHTAQVLLEQYMAAQAKK